MAKVVMKGAELFPRDSDVHLSAKQYLQISLFAGLKRPPTLDKFPGAIVVRRYRRNEELFRQGEAGWTAFYILTLDDVIAMQTARMEATRKEREKIALQLELNRLREDVQRRAARPGDEELRHAATVTIATLARNYDMNKRIRPLLEFKSEPIRNREGTLVPIPIGGPKTISWEKGEAQLFEGDLFGELSCLFRTPRSGTVHASRDCYIIEFLRHILDSVHRDPVYKARADGTYVKRFFELQIRKMPLFADLEKKEEIDAIRNGIELVSFEPGQIICDEHERSDCMYLVRQGLVKVMTNVSHLVGPHDVTDWAAFANTLRQGESLSGTPAGKFWSLLSNRAKGSLRAAELGKVGPADRTEILLAVNDVLKDRKAIDAVEFKPITDSEAFEKLLPPLPAKKQEWSDLLVRRHNRLILEALCQTGLRPHRRHVGVETILSYCSTNDYFGEMGLMLNQPRSATCMAFGHPNHEGTLELVRIPSQTFWKLIKMSPVVRDRVREEIGARRKRTNLILIQPVWEDTGQVQFSDQFAGLGLIQGQKLMLIDLDRCTRCDECVKACVGNHTDGNSRLFLDGPRFGKYLIPTTCRSCLDPVCMIPCPVSSIRRGDDKQIVIENWCIGCAACAEACPYGSIQMDDLGLIPEAARGWRWLPAPAKDMDGAWRRPGFRDATWRSGATPFLWARDFQDQLRAFGGASHSAIRFRREVEIGSALLKDRRQFKVELVSLGTNVRVWINGQELILDDRVKRGRHEFTIPPVAKAQAPKGIAGGPPLDLKSLRDFLRTGTNAIAVEVTPTCKPGETLMQLRLDAIQRPANLPQDLDESVAEEVVEKMVTHKAVVCDLCASVAGKIPACVHACPHDAAIRVDARTQFPAS